MFSNALLGVVHTWNVCNSIICKAIDIFPPWCVAFSEQWNSSTVSV